MQRIDILILLALLKVLPEFILIYRTYFLELLGVYGYFFKIFRLKFFETTNLFWNIN